MKPLTRDITITLLFKLFLLITLWITCFHGAQKPDKDAKKWLLGMPSIHKDYEQ